MTSNDAAEPEEATPPTKDESAGAEPQSPAGKTARAKAVKPAKQQQAGLVPNKAAEDDPRTWGDSESGNDNDAWLKEQKPPHWG